MLLAYNPVEPPYYKAGEIQRTREVNLRVVENVDAAAAGARYLVRLLVVCAGYVMTDVACDGVMVELAQNEPMEIRGQAQTMIYMVRYSASLVAGVTAALCFNGEAYGGSFSWSVAPNNVFWACAAVTMVGCCGTVLFLDEPRCSSSKLAPAAPLHEMWRILQQRAVWQLVAFHFWHSFLTSFSFSDLAAIQEFWVGVTPLTSSVAGCVSTALVVCATFLMRAYFLNVSWRLIMLVCSFVTSVVFFGVNVAATFDVVRSQWFYLGGPQLAAIPEGMRSVVAGFVTVEIAEHGFEGATYALLTTVHNMAWPFAQSVTNLVDAQFDVSDATIASDTVHVRWQVAYCLFIALGVQLSGLCTLVLLPDQKREAQELKRCGGSSRLAAWVAVGGIVTALVWATTTNLLAIHRSTACLLIAGGHGC
ncbi:hypothetical protein BBJ28_00001791 [Nothophytophthora sp. Chile5]|nr:hypothetical protein BBJ28_00001791 [Nothophytophthora sp. Chile5]